MNDYHMARRVMMEEVSGGPRPRLGCVNGVKVELGIR